MKNFAILSNNNNYSKLLINIYKLFYNQFNIENNYFIYKYDNNFYKNFIYFFNKNKLSNLNIDILLEKKFSIYCDLLSKNSYIFKSVNFIKKVSINLLQGFNTNSLSLISDLKRINFLKNNYIILILLKNKKKFNDIIDIVIKNSYKTIIYYKDLNIFENVKKNKKNFSINRNLNMYNIENNLFKYKFNLIIDVIYENFNNRIIKILKKIINFDTKYYHLFYYLNLNNKFLKYYKYKKLMNYSNGLGTLIYNVFYSFKIYNNLKPNLSNIFKKFNINV